MISGVRANLQAKAQEAAAAGPPPPPPPVDDAAVRGAGLARVSSTQGPCTHAWRKLQHQRSALGLALVAARSAPSASQPASKVLGH